MEGERNGIPSVGVMTEKFVSAAELMSRVLGAEGYRFVVTEHPFSSATNEELKDRARRTVLEGAALLTGSVA